jgi:alanyl-tRNA synthetase
MKFSDIRSSFLKYFERNGHRIVPSSPLVPHDDPTLLFTNAGMNQFKDLFLGKEQRDYRRATSSQKCMRVSGKHNDLDNVGPSFRHHTFFEMLGNFSFGDYFKREAIPFAWELLTDVWKLPPARLYATIFSGEAGIPRDDEALGVWRGVIPAERIVELGLDENFWSMGDTGPCGRCSEIHYFRGSHIECAEERAGRRCQGLACSCDRFVEIWNNVFMEFDRQPDGTLTPLPAPSIDTGMGLERITAVLQEKLSNYDTDLFVPLLGAIGDLAGTRHGGTMTASDVSMRIIADHTRAMTFLIADGVLPSNEWRGYVLRKIMRRAMRHGKRLGITEPFLHRLVAVVDREMGDAYPEVRAGRAAVEQVIRSEEERFDIVLSGGLPKLEEALEEAASGSKQVPGELAFRFYDTFGLPLDFIEDLASERHVGVDRDGFEKAMEAQRQKGRAQSAFDGRKAEDFTYASAESEQRLRAAGDRFEGYTTTVVKGVPVLAVFDDRRRQVNELREGEQGYLALENTPFYLEAGGQVSDSGTIYQESGSGEAIVKGLVRIGAGWPRLHRVRMKSGVLRERDLVTAEVDTTTRDSTRRNHTATHLLHAALRQVLGTHVKQAGSLVAPDRLRFDFVHFAPITHQQSMQIERIVNEQIYRNTPVQTEERSTDEAIAAGAMALFGEKYGDRVRVVSIPAFSIELCGGTHCRATGDIGLFTIVSEAGVAAGVRRIEAITGADALTYHQQLKRIVTELTEIAHTTPDQLPQVFLRSGDEVKRLERLYQQAKHDALMSMWTSTVGETGTPKWKDRDIAGVKFVVRGLPNLDKKGLRSLLDSIKQQNQRFVVFLASSAGDRVSMLASVSKDLAGRINAGQIVKQLAPIVGGAGGGRPDFAEAGGKDPSRIDELLAEGEKLIGKMLEGAESPIPNP